MDNISDKGVEFTFGKGKTTDKKETEKVIDETVVVTDVAETELKNEPVKSYVVDSEEDLNSSYVDVKSVTIKLVKNYSLFRKVNDKHMPKRRDYIGSSVVSSRTLASNPKEIEKYFPNIVGIPANHSEFMLRVKQYLNNIRVHVDEIGRKFDISFRYDTKRDYIKFLKEEEAIENAYNSINRKDTSSIKKALEEKIYKLNLLESRKCEFGTPVNIEDYIMYRHCLLYKDVAKDIALINSDSTIRFYFEDDKKEENKLKQHRIEIKNAKFNYVKCCSDDALFDAVFVQYCALSNISVLSARSMDRLSKEIQLDKFSTDEPKKFNALCNNKDIKIASLIENLIAIGELIRPQYSQNVLTTDGDLIGANNIEAIAWFKNPLNTEAVNVYMNKLKNI